MIKLAILLLCFSVINSQNQNEIIQQDNTQEEIINLVPRVYGSRSTIINLIKEGIVAGYIIKRNTSEDRRSVYYELDIDIYKAIDQWIINKKISYKDLVITRRVTKTVEQFTVSTLTHSALLRANALGHDILPGRKARFIVVRCDSRDPADRVVLVEEIEKQSNIKIDTAYYRELAVRATWAILAPYGWTDEEILAGSKVMTLFDFQE